MSQREVDESTQNIVRLRVEMIKSLPKILQNEPKARTELTIIVNGHLLCLEVSTYVEGTKELVTHIG